MTETLKERKDMDPAYEWDLTALFKDDSAFEESLQAVDEEVKKIASFRGTLHTAENIHAFFAAETEAERRLEDLIVYANQRHSEDTADAKAQSMYSRAVMKYTAYASAVAYAVPEILENDEASLKAFSEDPVLQDYAFTMQDLIRQKPHTLSAKEETLLSSFSDALSTGANVADVLMDADLSFDSVRDSAGNAHEVTESGYIPLQMSPDRELRKNSFFSFYKSYRQYIHTFSAAYAGTVKAACAEAKARGYASSREMSMAADNIPVSVYDNLIDTVRRNMDKMYRYVRLRKKILGVDELHYYDLYAPLSAGSTKKYTYDEAKEMVLQAVAPLGEDYVNRVRNAYSDGWIDVYPNKGKSGGAYSSGTYDSNPYIMLNFTGSLDSVSTLAHEMGHSQHSWLTNHTQPAQYAGYSLFVAEVASTVNENLLIEQLLRNCREPHERLALLNQYLEGFKGTVYRQTMFAEFEKEAHAMQERGESLDSASLSSLYARLIRDYFGEDLVMDEEVSYEWARIPHFYRPFYVYVYATGYTSAAALSEAILTEGAPARDRYLEFLSMGGSAYPMDELKHGGVDLSTPEPIQRALDKFGRVLDDAEKTYAEIEKEK